MTDEAKPTAPEPDAPQTGHDGAASDAPDPAAPPAALAPPPSAPSPTPEGRDGPPSSAAGEIPPGWTPSYVHLAVVSIVSLALDLGTKHWAKTQLPLCHPWERSQGHLEFCLAKNPGGAFGLLQGEPESIRRPFFLGISVLAVVFIVSLYRKLTPKQWALKWGLPLVLGGALGNLIDRIQDQRVIDFIDFRAEWWGWINRRFLSNASDHWPTFNVADIVIVAGVGLMAIDMFTPRPKVLSSPAAGTAATPAPGPAGSGAAGAGAAQAGTPAPPEAPPEAEKAASTGAPEPAAKET